MSMKLSLLNEQLVYLIDVASISGALTELVASIASELTEVDEMAFVVMLSDVMPPLVTKRLVVIALVFVIFLVFAVSMFPVVMFAVAALKFVDVRVAIVAVFDVKDRKSTRLNSSHQIISYAVFC